MTRITSNKQAFTLIELLVVVLIIGILAAVAVPQYQKAVDRAKAAEGVQLISSLQKAMEVWMLANPDITDTNDMLGENASYRLGIDLPCQYDRSGYGGTCWINGATLDAAVTSEYEDFVAFVTWYGEDVYNMSWGNYITIAAVRDANGNWTHRCGYQGNRGKAICEGLQGYQAEEGFDI